MRQKVTPVKSFVVFSAIAWNICVKFYKFTWLSYLRLTAKWNLMVSKYDKVIDSLSALGQPATGTDQQGC